jgi:serine phosphatase RsbU (regulator of sigma subunit)
VLGVLPEARYEQAKVKVSGGDFLVMYSDGLVEAENSQGEEMGKAD